MWKRALCLSLMSLLFVASSFAQGEFLEKGTNGFGVGAAFANNSDVTTFGADIGYSVSGQFDFGISIARGSLGDLDMTATVINPYVVIHVLKQDTVNFPISVAIGAGYEHDSFSADWLKALDLDLTGDYFLFGGAVYMNIPSGPRMIVQPRASFTLITGETEVSDSFGNSESEDDNTTVFTLGITLVFKSSLSSIVTVGPSVTFGENNTSFGVRLGYVVPLPN